MGSIALIAATALAAQMRDRRTVFNRQVAAARSRTPSFDTAGFAAFVREVVDPLCTALLAAEPDRAGAIADALFDMAVILTEHRWTAPAARSPVVGRLWADVAPRLARTIAADPYEGLGALTNSAIKLAQEPNVRLDQWL